jgi:16S rRNA (guanine1207-N2)-methyltransferase
MMPDQSAYHRLHAHTLRIAGASVAFVSKPGVIGFGTTDDAGRLLGEAVEAEVGARVVQLQCGSGVAAVAIASRAAPSALVLTDRSAAAVHAARGTLALHPHLGGEVRLCHGWGDAPREAAWDLVLFRIPTDKASLHLLLADAFALLVVGGRCAIAGATDEGVKSAATLLAALFGNSTVLATQAGHRVVSAVKRERVPGAGWSPDAGAVPYDAFHEVPVTLRGTPTLLASRPGVFSWAHLDEASALLADCMSIAPTDRVLDLGCGAGALGITAARLATRGQVTMVDVDVEAVRSAVRSATLAALPAARVLSSDVASAVLEESFDVVITNPPFHVGKQTDLTVPSQFIEDAWQVLVRGGTLQLVANRTLPYEAMLRARFGNCVTREDGRRFKVLVATKG